MHGALSPLAPCCVATSGGRNTVTKFPKAPRKRDYNMPCITSSSGDTAIVVNKHLSDVCTQAQARSARREVPAKVLPFQA